MAVVEHKEHDCIYSRSFDSITLSPNMYTQLVTHIPKNFGTGTLGMLGDARIMISKQVPDNYILLTMKNEIVTILKFGEENE